MLQIVDVFLSLEGSLNGGYPRLACGGGARGVWLGNVDRALTEVKLSPAAMARVKELREHGRSSATPMARPPPRRRP